MTSVVENNNEKVLMNKPPPSLDANKAAASGAESVNLENKLEILSDDSSSLSANSRTTLFGILYALGAAACFALANVLMKKARFFNGGEKTLVKLTIQLFILTFIYLCLKLNFLGPKGSRFNLLMRGIFGVLHAFAIFYAVSMIDPSDLVAINRCNLILVVILSRCFFKEKLNVIHILAILLTLTGVFFLSQPAFFFGEKPKSEYKNGTFHIFLIGIIIAIGGAVAEAISIIFAKRISDQNVHFTQNPAYVVYTGIPITLAIVVGVDLGQPNQDRGVYDSDSEAGIALQVMFLIFASISYILYQFGLALALKYGDASKIAIVMATDLLFTFMFQFEVLGIVSGWFAVIGAVLILAGSVLISVYKLLDNGKPPESCWEKFLCFKL